MRLVSRVLTIATLFVSSWARAGHDDGDHLVEYAYQFAYSAADLSSFAGFISYGDGQIDEHFSVGDHVRSEGAKKSSDSLLVDIVFTGNTPRHVLALPTAALRAEVEAWVTARKKKTNETVLWLDDALLADFMKTFGERVVRIEQPLSSLMTRLAGEAPCDVHFLKEPTAPLARVVEELRLERDGMKGRFVPSKYRFEYRAGPARELSAKAAAKLSALAVKRLIDPKAKPLKKAALD